MSSRITVAKTAGFCFGVKRAMETAYKLAESGGGCTLGRLIHNRHVTDGLADMGVTVANSIDEITGTVIIRSHGVGREVYDELERRGIPYIDATCPFVDRKSTRLNSSHST